MLRWKSKDSLARAKKQNLTTGEIESAKTVWVRWIQQEIVCELEDSAAIEKGVQDQGLTNEMVGDSSRDRKARTGKFKQLAPWKDREHHQLQTHLYGEEDPSRWFIQHPHFK